jgi:hypothetical protein
MVVPPPLGFRYIYIDELLDNEDFKKKVCDFVSD